MPPATTNGSTSIPGARQGRAVGATIAHGYLTLSPARVPLLGADLLKVEGTKMAINYGLNKLRFPNPVRVGSRVRAAGKLASFERTANGARIVVTVTIEIEGEPKPAAIAETIRQVVVEPAARTAAVDYTPIGTSVS